MRAGRAGQVWACADGVATVTWPSNAVITMKRAVRGKSEARCRAMTVIDIHPHIISDDVQRYPVAPVGGHQSDWSRSRPVSLPAMIAAMAAAGVERSALVQASTCYGHDNSYVADAVAAHPDKFTGVFSVD